MRIIDQAHPAAQILEQVFVTFEQGLPRTINEILIHAITKFIDHFHYRVSRRIKLGVIDGDIYAKSSVVAPCTRGAASRTGRIGLAKLFAQNLLKSDLKHASEQAKPRCFGVIAVIGRWPDNADQCLVGFTRVSNHPQAPICSKRTVTCIFARNEVGLTVWQSAQCLGDGTYRVVRVKIAYDRKLDRTVGQPVSDISLQFLIRERGICILGLDRKTRVAI